MSRVGGEVMGFGFVGAESEGGLHGLSVQARDLRAGLVQTQAELCSYLLCAWNAPCFTMSMPPPSLAAGRQQAGSRECNAAGGRGGGRRHPVTAAGRVAKDQVAPHHGSGRGCRGGAGQVPQRPRGLTGAGPGLQAKVHEWVRVPLTERPAAGYS